MNRHFFSCISIALGVLLFLFSGIAHAKFMIEFTDGSRMAVSNYKEEGRTFKVYTPQGSFAFRREDVRQIIDLNPEKEVQSSVPADTTLASPSAVEKAQPQRLEREPARQKKETVEKADPRAELARTKELLHEAAAADEVQGLIQWGKEGLFRLRYAFALILCVKLLKIFFTASVR